MHPPVGNNLNGDSDFFTNTIERVLATSESRGESHLEPFTAKELSSLSALCTKQANRKGHLDADLGFADVDPSTTGQLVEGLQKHVTLASSIDFVQEGYKALQSNSIAIETVRFNQTLSSSCALLCVLLSLLGYLVVFLYLYLPPPYFLSLLPYSGWRKAVKASMTKLVWGWKQLPSFCSSSIAPASIDLSSMRTPLKPRLCCSASIWARTFFLR